MKKKYTVRASKNTNRNRYSKVTAATNGYGLKELVIEGWDILERLGFTDVEDLMACDNGPDDLIVTDSRFYICYYSDIGSDSKESFLDALLDERCFPDPPSEYDYVDFDMYESIGEMITEVLGDFGA